MGQRLYERRVDSLKFHSRGIKPSLWTKELSQIYNVNPDTIWRDWNQRDTWLPLILDMENREAVFNVCVEENKQVKEAAWKLFHDAENDTAKACALKIILEVNDRLLDSTGHSPTVKIDQAKPFVIKFWREGDAEATVRE